VTEEKMKFFSTSCYSQPQQWKEWDLQVFGVHLQLLTCSLWVKKSLRLGLEDDVEVIKNRAPVLQIEDEALKILLVGSNDPRHILKTASRLKRHQHKKIEFYIIESQATALARHLLLFSTIFAEFPIPGIVFIN
jgi:hypothetical protein